MSQESIVFDDKNLNYGQDLCELLDDLFFGGCRPEIPDDTAVKNIINTIPLDNDFGQKYVNEILELSEIRNCENTEFSVLEDYLARVYYKHEIETKLISKAESTPELRISPISTEESLGFAEEIVSAEGVEEVEEEEESAVMSEAEADAGCIVPLVNLDGDESPEDVFGMASPIFTTKSDLGSIVTIPTEQEKLLLEKYAVLFAEPLFKSNASPITATYPSNRGIAKKRLAASGNEVKLKKSCSTTSARSKNQFKDLSQRNRMSAFQAIPTEIIFTNCEPGNVYSATLALRNITTATQQCCVLPPKSGFFSVGEGHYPTENKNFVSPGLSCKFTVKFRPKVFTAYEDRIQVNVSQGLPLTVKLFGRRINPELEMPYKWDCGDCFCGNEVKMEFTIKNLGGFGKFWLYVGDLQLEDVQKIFSTNFELENINQSKIETDPFSITPTKFTLKPKEKQTFTVIFKPRYAGHFCDSISILCDNLTCLEKFFIAGRSLSMSMHLVSLKCRWNFVRPHETWDVFAEHFLNFDTIYAGNEETLTFTMRNNSYLSIQYHWKTYRPLFNPEKIMRIAVEDLTLSIHPLKGVLAGHCEQIVKLIYKPQIESTLHVIVQLVVENIPRVAVDKTMANVEVLTDNYRAVNVLLNFVDVQGKCIEYNLAISPPQLLIHGALEVGTTHRQLIQLINHKRVPAYFKWSRCTYPNFVEVEPVVGFIGATYEMTLEVKITGLQIGKFVETLYCEVQGVRKLLQLQVAFRICGHKVVIESGNVNLGLIRAGNTGEGSLIIRNTVPIRVPWSIMDSTQRQTEMIKLKLNPRSGELGPLSMQKITVSCCHHKPASIKSTLQLEVEGNFQAAIAVMGEIIEPNVYLQTCTFFAGTVYRSVPFTTIVTLINNSALDTTFCWDEAEGVDAKSCTIHFEPTKGSIGANESKAVCVTCTVNHLISFHDVCVPCWIEGMSEPIYWSVSGEVNGIEIFCSLDNDSRRYCATLKEGGCEVEPNFDLDFGTQVQLGAVTIREFNLTNNSAILASFKITGENFIAIKLDEWEKAIEINKKFPEYSNKKIQATLEGFLKTHNHGLAIIIYPPIGNIPAFNSATIQVIGLSDMWGLYNEAITVQVAKVKPIHMKVGFNSVGLPLKFLAGPKNDSVFKLRFGNHLANGIKESRRLKVINTGPCDLTIAFKTYVDTQKIKKPLVVRLDLHKYSEVENANEKSIDKMPTIQENTSENQSRANLIELSLLPYYGKINNTIFHLSPNPLFIGARSESNITVDFMPPVEEKINKYLKCGIPKICCRCTGNVLLNRNLLKITNKVGRQHGRKVANFDFEVSARLTIPKFVHVSDGDDEEAFIFRLNAGAFLFGRPEIMCKKKKLSFRNDCAVPLHAIFSTAKPFSISCSSKTFLSSLCEKSVEATKPMLVEPGNIVQLELEFTLKRFEVDKICHSAPCHTQGEKCSSKDCIWNYCTKERPYQLHFEKPLKIKILEGVKKQEFQLKGNLYLPFLTLATNEIDFGTCFVGQITCQGLGILNPSICDCSFCVVYESSTNEFRVEPTEGNVPGCHLKELPGRTELDVFFTPNHNKEYNQIVIVHGPFGMDPLHIELKGIGTYDSKYRREYDVVDST